MDELEGSSAKLSSKVGRYLVRTKCLDVILALVVEIILQKYPSTLDIVLMILQVVFTQF